MLEDDEDVTNLARGVPHYLPLRNALGDRFLMVRGGLILHLLGLEECYEKVNSNTTLKHNARTQRSNTTLEHITGTELCSRKT